MIPARSMLAGKGEHDDMENLRFGFLSHTFSSFDSLDVIVVARSQPHHGALSG